MSDSSKSTGIHTGPTNSRKAVTQRHPPQRVFWGGWFYIVIPIIYAQNLPAIIPIKFISAIVDETDRSISFFVA